MRRRIVRRLGDVVDVKLSPNHRRLQTWLHRVAALFVVVLAAVAAGAGLSGAYGGAEASTVSVPGTLPPHGGALVFESDLGIFVANVDGSGLKPLQSGADGLWGRPVWSPDGEQIAFEHYATPAAAGWVYVMNADGSNLRRLGHFYGEFAWSPDGSRIALQEDSNSLTVVTVRGAARRSLLEGCAFAWAHDGTKLAYASEADYKIHVYDLPSGTSTAVGGPLDEIYGCDEGSVAWSPNGTRIAYEGSDKTLELIDVATHHTAHLGPSFSRVWSPDGTKLAYDGGKSDTLHLLDLATGRVTDLGFNAGWPTWSPDGTRMAYLGSGGRLDVIVLASGRVRHLASGASGRIAWTGDGSILLYCKERFRGSSSLDGHRYDIWRVRADATGAATAITHAFPTGAAFGPAFSWTARTVPPVPPEHISMLTLRPAHFLTLASPVRDLSADGGRAAILAKLTDLCGPVGVWDPHGGITWLASSSCDGRIYGWWNGEFVIAAGRVAWIDAKDASDSVFDYVEAGTLASGTTTVAETDKEGEWLDNLAGDGPLLVYNSWNGSKPKLWRIIGARKASAQLLLAGQDAGAVEAVDAGRIAVLRRDGNLVLLDDRGRRLSSFRLDGKGIEGVRLTGSQLVVQRGGAFEVRDATSEVVKHRWPAARSIAPITLEDAQGNFAVYTAGIAIHLLRLSDGRDRVLRIANQAQPAHADLEPNGLYYSYNATGSTKPGRLAFVPFSQLLTRF